MGDFVGRRRCCSDCTHLIDPIGDWSCKLGVPNNVIIEPESFVCARNEIRPPDFTEHPRFPGFYTRGWYDDPRMTGEAYRLGLAIEDLRSDDIVMDIGSHVGSFGAAVLRRSSTVKVVFVDADPVNWPILRLNASYDSERTFVVERCVTGKPTPNNRVTLWRTGYSGCGSVIWRKRFFNTIVPSITFDEIIDVYHPTIIKSDVEGAEHDYSWNVNPELRHLHIEIHSPEAGKGLGTFKTCADKFVNMMIDKGFELRFRKDRMSFTVLWLART